jgi:hypothetical protein
MSHLMSGLVLLAIMLLSARQTSETHQVGERQHLLFPMPQHAVGTGSEKIFDQGLAVKLLQQRTDTVLAVPRQLGGREEFDTKVRCCESGGGTREKFVFRLANSLHDEYF